MLGPGRAEETHLSPIRSRLSAFIKPKSPVWMTAVASCSRINRFNSWSVRGQLRLTHACCA